MTILSWIQTHPTVVGGVIISVIVLVGGTIIFFVIRKIRRNLKNKAILNSQYGVLSQVAPNVQPMKEVKSMVKKPVYAGIATRQVPAATKYQQRLVDLNALTVEELEQLLGEKKALTESDVKRTTLMQLSKEELVELIIDSQIDV